MAKLERFFPARIPVKKPRFSHADRFLHKDDRSMTVGQMQTSLQRTSRQRAWARALPFLLFIALLALRGAIDRYDPAFDARWLYGVQCGLPVLALLWFRADYVELAAPKWNQAGIVASIAVGLGVFAIWVLPMSDWMRLGEATVPFEPVDEDGQVLWGLVAVRAFGAILVVPLMEELFWRSFLLRWFDQRNFLGLAPAAVSWTAILSTSAVFALAHSLWLAGLVAGIAYALLYRQLGSLWYAILAHAATNGLLAIWVVARQDWAYW